MYVEQVCLHRLSPHLSRSEMEPARQLSQRLNVLHTWKGKLNAICSLSVSHSLSLALTHSLSLSISFSRTLGSSSRASASNDGRRAFGTVFYLEFPKNSQVMCFQVKSLDLSSFLHLRLFLLLLLAGHVYTSHRWFSSPSSFPLPPTLLPPNLLLFLALAAETATQEVFREGVCESACCTRPSATTQARLGALLDPFTTCSANAAFRSTRRILTSSFSEMSRDV